MGCFVEVGDIDRKAVFKASRRLIRATNTNRIAVLTFKIEGEGRCGFK